MFRMRTLAALGSRNPSARAASYAGANWIEEALPRRYQPQSRQERGNDDFHAVHWLFDITRWRMFDIAVDKPISWPTQYMLQQL